MSKEKTIYKARKFLGEGSDFIFAELRGEPGWNWVNLKINGSGKTATLMFDMDEKKDRKNTVKKLYILINSLQGLADAITELDNE